MSDPVLEVGGLSVTITNPDGSETPILTDVDLTIERGSVLGIVGESGSGKTMLLRTLLRILPTRASRTWDHVQFDGRDVTADFDRVRLPISMVFQDPLTSFNPLRRIGGHLTEVVRRFHPVSRSAARTMAAEALAQVGLPDPERAMRQYPHQLSGGMRQRVMIAMALLAEPELLVADEPTTALDATIQAQILALLASLQHDRGCAVAIVTHDLGVVAALCDHVIVMKDGAVVESGPVAEVLQRPSDPYTQSLLAAVPGGAIGGSV